MVSIVYVILSLLFLYISKHKLSIEFSRLIHRFGGNRNSLIIFWSIIFLPGTVIHEMSHFLFAILTGARTGKIEIFPSFLEEDWENEEGGSGVTLGYVQTQRLNPLQGFLVGTAPFLVGIGLLVWLASMIKVSYDNSLIYLLLFQGYLFFTVSNSFFPSWSDIKQTIPLLVTLSIVSILIWLLGFQFLLQPNSFVFGILDTISLTLVVSTTINILIIGLILFLRRVSPRRR